MTVSAAKRAKALSDPTRLTLAVLLAQRPEIRSGDLAKLSGTAPNVVSHHLRILLEAELAERRRVRKEAFYSLTEEGRRLLVCAVGADAMPAGR